MYDKTSRLIRPSALRGIQSPNWAELCDLSVHIDELQKPLNIGANLVY